MATTIGSFSAIDDSEVDAESPITETLITRLRDNSYWIDAGTRKTTQTSQTKVLVPDGSGGAEWVELSTITGAGDKGLFTSISTTWVTITSATSGLLRLDVEYSQSTNNSNIRSWVDLSDDSFVSVSRDETHPPATNYSGTITTGSTLGIVSTYNFELRRNSGNMQYRLSLGSIATGFGLIWAIA